MSTNNTVTGEVAFQKSELNIFPDKQKLREFFSTRPALQEILKGVIQAEMKRC